MEKARQHSSVTGGIGMFAVNCRLPLDKTPGEFGDGGGHDFAYHGKMRLNLSLSGHRVRIIARKTTVARIEEVFYSIHRLSGDIDLPNSGSCIRSDSVKPCVANGERTHLGRRADNTVLCERRRQTCPPPSKPFWPLAFSPSFRPALSRKKSSWSSRSWKKSPWASSDYSEASGARSRTRQTLASRTGGRPC